MHSLALVCCSHVPTAIIIYAIACYKDVVLQVRNIDTETEIGFEKPCEPKPLKHLVLLDYSPAETPDVHALLLRSDIKAASAHLQHLEISLPFLPHARDGLDIISEHGHLLEHLTIAYPCTTVSVQGPTPPINLPALPGLRFLDIQVSVPSPSHRLDGIPDSLFLSIVGLPAVTPNLELLTIALGPSTRRFFTAPLPSAVAADEALMRLHLSHLNEVRLTVTFFARVPDKHDLYTEIRGDLPCTNAAGILSVSEDVPTRWDAMSHFAVS
ncbi:hypothetical protein C8R45DRAFT_945474 [Mycena sanguinolenta]|nr:hypothetical protein C8R45DRAFT_945474 [Mycena sanguinolenta]